MITRLVREQGCQFLRWRVFFLRTVRVAVSSFAWFCECQVMLEVGGWICGCRCRYQPIRGLECDRGVIIAWYDAIGRNWRARGKS